MPFFYVYPFNNNVARFRKDGNNFPGSPPVLSFSDIYHVTFFYFHAKSSLLRQWVEKDTVVINNGSHCCYMYYGKKINCSYTHTFVNRFSLYNFFRKRYNLSKTLFTKLYWYWAKNTPTAGIKSINYHRRIFVKPNIRSVRSANRSFCSDNNSAHLILFLNLLAGFRCLHRSNNNIPEMGIPSPCSS